MPDFLGEEAVSVKGTPFESFGPMEWALEFIAVHGGTDGDHHKAWVLDQAARILNGTPVELRLAQWADGQKEYRYDTGEPTAKYLAWVQDQKGSYDNDIGEYEYGYDIGIPP